ncbi:hypothetical protein OG413_20600 [Streptomyces sp. NBC_01433]|uniref:hypothetical protein n=1 Tax=Streptomyces sp. NBC_01433 TaxID=2903864 RepID=UPI002258B3F5|nr:hypothetical protein [Streptomyces sp. NBC_01433]MCX4677675.1 hypothetical protein [Streptomyces sp. NBC_01433]
MSTPASTLAHRSVFAVPDAGALLDTVRWVSGAWLKKKFPHTAVQLGTGQQALDESSLLLSQAAYDDGGTEYATRIQLREDKAEATWRTTVTAVRSTTDVGGTVSVDLECFPNTTQPIRTGKPGLIRDLVAELEPYDGLSRLSVNALRVTHDRVHSLVDVLCDPERQMPTLVAARPTQPNRLWSDRVAGTMRDVAGDASTYLLWDLAAVDAFREATGHDHRVGPGTLRTFLPDVDPAWAPDAARHRLMGPARWTDPADQMWRGVARRVHALALERPLPRQLSTVAFPDRVAEQHRQERRETMDKARLLTAVPAQRAGEHDEELRAEVTLLNGLLEQADKELSELNRTAALAGRTTTSMQEQLQAVIAERDNEVEDHLTTLESLQQARVEADRLRLLLLRQGRFEEAVEVAEGLPMPASFEEVWERLGELEHLTVTADQRIAVGLDEHPMSRTWAAKGWTALVALDSYAAAVKDGFNGSFYHFCKTPPAGAKPYPVRQVAMTESGPTMEKYGHERLFPLPDGEFVEMQAHLKINARGRIAPRVYFLDEVKGTRGEGAGRLVVGYVGPHLTNMRTN